MTRLGAVRHHTMPMTTCELVRRDSPPHTPVRLVMMGIDTFHLRSLLKSQPVWRMFTTLPAADAKLYIIDDIPNFASPYAENVTSNTFTSQRLANSPTSAIT